MKFKNAGIKSAKEFVKRVLDNEAIYSHDGAHVATFNPNNQNNFIFCNKTDNYPINLTNFDNFLIEEDSEWYDNIPEHGVLCWVSVYDRSLRDNIAIVEEYLQHDEFKFLCSCGETWGSAIPLTEDEIKQFFHGVNK